MSTQTATAACLGGEGAQAHVRCALDVSRVALFPLAGHRILLVGVCKQVDGACTGGGGRRWRQLAGWSLWRGVDMLALLAHQSGTRRPTSKRGPPRRTGVLQQRQKSHRGGDLADDGLDLLRDLRLALLGRHSAGAKAWGAGEAGRARRRQRACCPLHLPACAALPALRQPPCLCIQQPAHPPPRCCWPARQPSRYPTCPPPPPCLSGCQTSSAPAPPCSPRWPPPAPPFAASRWPASLRGRAGRRRRSRHHCARPPAAPRASHPSPPPLRLPPAPPTPPRPSTPPHP